MLQLRRLEDVVAAGSQSGPIDRRDGGYGSRIRVSRGEGVICRSSIGDGSCMLACWLESTREGLVYKPYSEFLLDGRRICLRMQNSSIFDHLLQFFGRRFGDACFLRRGSKVSSLDPRFVAITRRYFSIWRVDKDLLCVRSHGHLHWYRCWQFLAISCGLVSPSASFSSVVCLQAFVSLVHVQRESPLVQPCASGAQGPTSVFSCFPLSGLAKTSSHTTGTSGAQVYLIGSG